MNTENIQTWNDMIRGFLQSKQDAEEEKYLKNTLIKSVAKSYEEKRYFGKQDLKDFFDPKKNKKEESQTSLEFQRDKYFKMQQFTQKPKNINWSEIQFNYQKKYEALQKKYEATLWLEDAAANAASVSFATHVVKLTHSKIDSPSFLDQIDTRKPAYLTTSTLKEKIIDGAVAGNQYAPIFQFLELELQGKKLAPEFENENNTILEPFASNEAQLLTWNNGFKQALVAGNLATHPLSKQIYFPVKQGTGNSSTHYHLLCQVTSSSLAQTMYEAFFDADQKNVKKAYDKNVFASNNKVSFPGRAHLSVTASNHSNASQLNGKRGGKLYLLSAQPPVWQSQLKPPIYSKSWFDRGIPLAAVKEDITYLRDFLLRFEYLGLSTKDPKRRRWIDRWVNRIISNVLLFAEAIQNLPAGWSDNSEIKLKPEQRYFLDPYRADAAFRNNRKTTDWQSTVCSDFAYWLNRKLSGKDKKFTPQREHTRLWRSLMKQPLRESSDMIDAALGSQEEKA